MEKKWHINRHDSTLVAALASSANLPPVVAQLLVARGISDRENALGFLDVKLTGLRDPELLPGLSRAADQITDAITAKRRIIIYGDYDADGMTSTAILFRCLRLLDANVGYFVPNRMDEGYGIHSTAIEKLAKNGAKMIISVDCGITSIEQAETAKRIGVELIITDHHEMNERLPDATIVHPNLPGTNYPFHGLCGAGVAFKLAWGLCQRAGDAQKVSPRCRNFLMSAIGLAAMGTIADVVPLVDENRIIVTHGLRCLKANPIAGIDCLMKLTSLDKKPALNSEDIGFVLGPRLNAAGRLGQAQLGVELLTTENVERANSLAEYINELNNSRVSLERSILKSANAQIEERFDPKGDPALVLADRGWHKGVIGIVAGRLADKYHRPVVVISFDELGAMSGTGSARSVPGVDLHKALNACSEHLITHGGHAAAAGLRIDEPQIDLFRAHFCEQISEQFLPERRVAELIIDAEASLSSMTMKTVRQIESLSPFGQSNPRPLFCTSNASLAVPAKTIGKGDRHLSVTFEQHGVKLRGIAFNRAEWADEFAATKGPLDIAYRPIINEFRGMRTVELQLVDWRPSQHFSAASA